MNKDIIIENQHMQLIIGDNCIVKSLICKETGEECIEPNEEIALFSATVDRPYNNEVKLSYPNKRTVYQADSISRDGNKLTVGFEITEFKAIVEIVEAPDYVAFKLVDFIFEPDYYGSLCMTLPPVVEFRMIQLPIKKQPYYGNWINVSWNEKTAVDVIAISPLARADAENRARYRILYADALIEMELKGCRSALICCPTDKFLDAMDSVEEDFDLPRGVQSRRSPSINRSAYWNSDITPATVDQHIAYAKQAGLTHMLIYYPAVFKSNGYALCGDYEYRDEYPNGAEDLKKMLDKIKAAGITPGIHFLQTHIGLQSSYVTPVADSRLNLKRRFTLSEPLSEDDTTVYVEQNPTGSIMFERCRVLQFDGELIHYDGYTTERPYRFTGCKRGHFKTNVTKHEKGCRGGILDISEFGATSCYIDETTSLQEEVAEKLADAYDAGFEFIYFDGSEGTDVPFDIEVPRGQYTVYNKLKKKPLFTEGAAKAHFSWHWLSGANAFDVFPTPIFKEMIKKFPAAEAPLMRQNFSRLNFGWWAYYPDTEPDIYEYGDSRAAAWDCPVTMMANPSLFETNARTPDNLEVLRRWEDVRARNWLTDEQKKELRNLEQEHILLIDENGEYELCPYDKIDTGDAPITAFIFERKNRRYVVYWHKTAGGDIRIPFKGDVKLEKELGGEQLSVTPCDDGIIIGAEGRRYLSTECSSDMLKDAFAHAETAE